MKITHQARRSIRYSIFIGVLAGSVFSASGAFAAITVNQDNFYDVISASADEDYVLGGNIDISKIVAGGATVFGIFYGTLDGAGRTISNLSTPLFSSLYGNFETTTVKNLRLRTDTSSGIIGNGALSNEVAMGSSIENVHVIGDVDGVGDYVGGLVGKTGAGVTITDSSFTGNVTGTGDYVGGLVGYSLGDISWSSANVSVSTTSGGLIGGLAGFIEGDITNSNAIISGNIIGDQAVGGLVGFIDGNISDSNVIVNGNVTGGAGGGIGGLAGILTGSITNSEAVVSGNVIGTGANIGGLAGYVGGDITNSNTTVARDVSGSQRVGGLTGNAAGNVTNSHADINGDVVSSGEYVGGLIGVAAGTITNSNAIVGRDVIGSAQVVGGLAGAASGNVTNSYASIGRDVIGVDQLVGGLIGLAAGNISNSYSIIGRDVSGDQSVGGLGGDIGGDISNSYAIIGRDVIGTNERGYLYELSGGLVGGLGGAVRGDIEHSYSVVGGSVTADFYDLRSMFPVGGLVGRMFGSTNNSYAFIGQDVKSSGSDVGGLIGSTDFSISNSQVTVNGSVLGQNNVGGLAASVVGNIYNSNSMVLGNISGATGVGGLAGSASGATENSNSYIGGNLEGTGWWIGGLLGACGLCSITNSDTQIQGNLVGNRFVGGIVGAFYEGSMTNSDSSIMGTMSSLSDIGGLTGGYYGGSIIGSYFSPNNVVSDGMPTELFGYTHPFYTPNLDYSNPSYVWDITPQSEFPTMLQVINGLDGPAIFAMDKCLNESNPYLVSLRSNYESSCPTGPARSFREVAEVRSAEKIEKTIGFKNDAPLPKDGVIAFVDSAAKFDVTKVKAVQIVPTENVKAVVKVGEALQISLNSESKEPVELWVKTPYGGWLLVGVITFDKDGKAVLPPLHFKNAGDYSLVLSKPTADSAKGSEPLNQSGSVLVEVS